MGETDKAFRSPADRAAAIGALFIFTPVGVMCAAGAAAHGFDAGSLIVLGLVLAGVLWAMVLVTRAAAFVECSPEWITVGLVPFWRTRLLRREVIRVAVVRIDTYAEFGGWGIKGSARNSKGRLYSVGGERAVRIEVRDGRTFVVAFKEPATAECALQTLQGPV
ncbi:hypothetical protein [Curtobacterium sp. MCBA15_005]|uniref:hypothetical protein n=1 Tax=Curtobacterium sp. MCBA15_005 TaxID=1898734 RepID=UPI0008DCE6B0|nr:hypothetical protein [Curtobacterium sp. MCBA15_005]OII02712.1 hypothetical protein BIU89_02365 [Curtobacterium sp. MCBA15_005]